MVVTSDGFKTMYGKGAKFVDVTNVNSNHQNNESIIFTKINENKYEKTCIIQINFVYLHSK